MKFHIQYRLSLVLNEELDAPTVEGVKAMAEERMRVLTGREYPGAAGAFSVMPTGRFSLSEARKGTVPQLLLDGVPLEEGQILLAYGGGKGEPLPGRVRFNPQTRSWYLDRREFVGHTYLDSPLEGSYLDRLRAARMEEEAQ